jgi:hypothetical protein
MILQHWYAESCHFAMVYHAPYFGQTTRSILYC